MFRLLGLHPGEDFDAFSAAALALTSPREAESLLEALVDTHLLQQPAASRYSFHDLLREYARELALAEGDEPRARLHDYYLAAATAATDRISHEVRRFEPTISHPPRHLPQMANMDAALSWLAAEHASLVAMTAATDGWQLACVLRTYFEHRGHFADWRTTHERALRNAEPDPLGTTLIRFNMGALAMWTGRLVEGMDHFHHALACNVNDQQLVATALTSLGMLAHLLHRDVEAAGYLRQALAIDHDNPRTTALGWNNLGLAEGRLGQRDAALEHHRRALALARQIGSRTAERAILLGLGETSLRLGLPAAQPFRQARELARAGRFRIQEALALDGPVVVIVGRGALSAMKRGVTDCDGRCEVVGRESRYRRGKDLFEVGAGVPPPTDRLHQHPTGVEQHGSWSAKPSHAGECMCAPGPRVRTGVDGSDARRRASPRQCSACCR